MKYLLTLLLFSSAFSFELNEQSMHVDKNTILFSQCGKANGSYFSSELDLKFNKICIHRSESFSLLSFGMDRVSQIVLYAGGQIEIADEVEGIRPVRFRVNGVTSIIIERKYKEFPYIEYNELEEDPGLDFGLMGLDLKTSFGNFNVELNSPEVISLQDLVYSWRVGSNR